jgi:hypothetical protein
MQFGASVRHLAFIFCRRYLNWQTFADAAHVSSTAYFLRRTVTLMSATGTDSQKCVIGETVWCHGHSDLHSARVHNLQGIGSPCLHTVRGIEGLAPISGRWIQRCAEHRTERISEQRQQLQYKIKGENGHTSVSGAPGAPWYCVNEGLFWVHDPSYTSAANWVWLLREDGRALAVARVTPIIEWFTSITK